MSKTIHRMIGDTPYYFTPNEFGWGVTSAEKRTDRFHRTYQVWTDANGRPTRCSCPHCFHTTAWCKHLKAVEEIYREQHPEVLEQLKAEAARCGVPVEPTREELEMSGLIEGPNYRDFPPPNGDDPEAYAEMCRDDEIDLDVIFGRPK